MPTVSVEHLSKRYGEIDAVNDVAFEVQQGEVFALLGPNGAGKTTTIEILEGFRQRDQGRVEVLGYDPADSATSRQLRERLGVVLQELAVEPFLSVRQALTRNAGYYPRPRPVDEVLELVGLECQGQRPCEDPFGGPAAATRPRARDRRESRAARSGRTHHRFRPVGSSLGLGSCPIDDRRRHDCDPDDSLHGRGGSPGRSCRGDQCRPDHRRRLARITRWTRRGDVTIRFRLPPTTSVNDLPVPAEVSDSGAVEITTDKEIEVLASLTTWALRDKVELIGLIVERRTLEDVYLHLTGYAPGQETATTEAES